MLVDGLSPIDLTASPVRLSARPEIRGMAATMREELGALVSKTLGRAVGIEFDVAEAPDDTQTPVEAPSPEPQVPASVKAAMELFSAEIVDVKRKG